MKGWLATRRDGDHVEQAAAFGYLKRLGSLSMIRKELC